MLKSLACVSAALLGACAPVSSTGIYRTSVELTIASEKSPREFAMCVADAFPDAGRLLNEGEHYWLTRQHGGATFERWDFTPANWLDCRTKVRSNRRPRRLWTR